MQPLTTIGVEELSNSWRRSCISAIARRLASVARQVDVWAAGQAGRIGGATGAGSGAGAGRGGGGGGRQPQSLNITNIVNNPVGVPAEDSLQAVGKRNAVTMRLVAPGVQ